MMMAALKRILSGARFQPYWESVHRRVLGAMNFGRGSTVATSGEVWVLKWLAESLLGDEPVVFDVGANRGDFAQQVLSNLKQGVRMHCFEPSKESFQALRNRFDDDANVIVHNFGFGASAESRKLFLSTGHSGLSSVYQRRLDHLDIEMDIAEEIELTTIDSFCEISGILEVDFLKLDVEGHELEVLKGATRLLTSNSIKAIQFEFGSCNIDSRTFFQDFWHLLNPRYNIYRILRNGLAFIDTYKESHEIFVTTNYLAVAKELNPANWSL